MADGGNQQGARFRIGPLTTYVEAAELTAWHRGAAPGDRCTYAIGPALGSRAGAAQLARELAARGAAHLFQERDGKGWRYCIEKRAAPVRPDGRVVPLDPASIEGRLLALLTRAADASRPCPTNEELAEALGLGAGHEARYRFGRLIEGGHLRLIESRRFGGRVIEVAATGARTAALGMRSRR